MLLFQNIISDRGFKYSVCGTSASSKAEVLAFFKTLKKIKKYAKATHYTWAMLLSREGTLKNDDGEAGASMVIVRMLEREQLFDHVVVLTRRFGGTQSGGVRFRRVQDCLAYRLESR